MLTTPCRNSLLVMKQFILSTYVVEGNNMRVAKLVLIYDLTLYVLGGGLQVQHVCI